MTKYLESEYEGYRIKRTKCFEKEYEGELQAKNGRIKLLNLEDNLIGDARKDILAVLQRLSGHKVRIKIVAWKDEEVKKTTDFDPFSNKNCPECGQPLKMYKGARYCENCGWNKDAEILKEKFG